VVARPPPKVRSATEVLGDLVHALRPDVTPPPGVEPLAPGAWSLPGGALRYSSGRFETIDGLARFPELS
jgi:hypothetical protein